MQATSHVETCHLRVSAGLDVIRRDKKQAHREMVATLGSGLFTTGVWDMLSVIVPLYAVAVGLNPAEIGLLVSARSVLPALLSIHGGIVMDQFGTRRVLLWVAAGCTLMPLLFPVCGRFAALGLLQLWLGLASALGLSASQTWAMQISRGDTAVLAHFSVAGRIGTFIGPVVIGLAWDYFGAWTAFGCVSLAAAAGAAAAGPVAGAMPERPHGVGAKVLLPRWEPHKQALQIALIPSVAFILLATFVRNSSASIQGSLFVVYLKGVGMSGTLIGLLVATAEVCAVAGAFMAASAEQRLGRFKLILLCIAVSVLCIASTPLLASLFALLIVACILRGGVQGLSQPLTFAILKDEVAGDRLGASIGLRNVAARFASIVTPAVMGMVAERNGIEASFYIIGAALLAMSGALALVFRRQSI